MNNCNDVIVLVKMIETYQLLAIPVKTTRISSIVTQNPKINLATSSGVNFIVLSSLGAVTVAVAVDILTFV